MLLKKEDNQANLENRKLFQQLERVENELNRVNEDVAGTSKQILKQNVVRATKLRICQIGKRTSSRTTGSCCLIKREERDSLKDSYTP